jgi:NAD+ kinase
VERLKPERVGIILKPHHPRSMEVFGRVCRFLEGEGIERGYDEATAVQVDEPGTGRPRRELCEWADLVLTLGGDGTLLSVARVACDTRTPLLGINLGELGFLTAASADGAEEVLAKVLAGPVPVEDRMMLRARHRRDGRIIECHDVLNDAVLTKAALARILEIELVASGDYVCTYRADGLIISTPTGSTAYNLAADGPIVLPTVGALVVSPICPHTLTLSPVVFPDTTRFELRVLAGDAEAFLSLDGQIGAPLQPGDVVQVEKSGRVARLVRAPGRDHFQVLRSKLHWGAGPGSRPAPDEG